ALVGQEQQLPRRHRGRQSNHRPRPENHHRLRGLGKRFALVASFRRARSIHQDRDFQRHRLRFDGGFRGRRSGRSRTCRSCQSVGILGDGGHFVHIREAEFCGSPLPKSCCGLLSLPAIGASRGSFWAFGLPFISSAFAERPNHSTRVPLFVIKHLSPRTGVIFRISYFELEFSVFLCFLHFSNFFFEFRVSIFEFPKLATRHSSLATSSQRRLESFIHFHLITGHQLVCLVRQSDHRLQFLEHRLRHPF